MIFAPLDLQDDREFAMSLTVRLLLHNASAFHRRIVWPVGEFPLRLLQFADLSQVRRLAKLLLEKSNLEKNAANFRLSFRE